MLPCEVVPTRVNYSSGKLLIKLTSAVEDWLGKKGQYLLSIFSRRILRYVGIATGLAS